MLEYKCDIGIGFNYISRTRKEILCIPYRAVKKMQLVNADKFSQKYFKNHLKDQRIVQVINEKLKEGSNTWHL